jgi:hypothetical protein
VSRAPLPPGRLRHRHLVAKPVGPLARRRPPGERVDELPDPRVVEQQRVGRRRDHVEIRRPQIALDPDGQRPVGVRRPQNREPLVVLGVHDDRRVEQRRVRVSVMRIAETQAHDPVGLPDEVRVGRGDERRVLDRLEVVDRIGGEAVNEQREDRPQPDQPPRPPLARDDQREQGEAKQQRQRRHRPLELSGDEDEVEPVLKLRPPRVRPVRHPGRRKNGEEK